MCCRVCHPLNIMAYNMQTYLITDREYCYISRKSDYSCTIFFLQLAALTLLYLKFVEVLSQVALFSTKVTLKVYLLLVPTIAGPSTSLRLPFISTSTSAFAITLRPISTLNDKGMTLIHARFLHLASLLNRVSLTIVMVSLPSRVELLRETTSVSQISCNELRSSITCSSSRGINLTYSSWLTRF